MVIVFFREFKSLFKNLKAMLCIAALVFASGMFLVVNNINTGYPGIQAVFSNMSLAAALAIPPVAASSISDDRRKESDALLRALPVTVCDIVIGKFLAIFAFFMIPTAVLALYPTVLSVLGAGSTAQGYIILLMFIALEVFLIALSMMISSFSRKNWKAMLVTYSILTALFLFGMMASLFGGVVEQVMRFVSPFRRFDPIVFGMFDLTSLLCYLSFAALFLLVSFEKFKDNNAYAQKAKRSGMGVSITAVVLAVATLGINVGAVILPESKTRLDISDNGIYEISESTVQFLENIDEDITVYLINPYAAEEKLHSYIRRYCEQNSKIKLKEVDTTKDTEFLTKYGMTEAPSYYSLIIESGKRWRFVDSEEFFSYYHAEMGFMAPTEYVYYGTYYEQLYSYYEQKGATKEDLSTLYDMIESLATESVYCFNAEEPITESREYVLADKIPTVYFVTGHGEKNTASNPLDITAIAEIPSNAALLIINDPETDYTASEIAMLQKYSDRGGKLLVLTAPEAYSMGRLCGFMKGFGLSLKDGAVSADGSTTVSTTVNTSAPVFSGASLTKVDIINGSSIVTEDIDGLKYTPMLTYGVIEGEGDEAETTTETLAVAVTKNNAPKLIWITGADTFNRSSADMTDAEKTQYTYAAYCIQYSTLWLHTAFSSRLSFEQPKQYDVKLMSVSSGEGTVIGVVFICLIPLGIVGSYFCVKYVRKKRSKAVVTEE